MAWQVAKPRKSAWQVAKAPPSGFHQVPTPAAVKPHYVAGGKAIGNGPFQRVEQGHWANPNGSWAKAPPQAAARGFVQVHPQQNSHMSALLTALAALKGRQGQFGNETILPQPRILDGGPRIPGQPRAMQGGMGYGTLPHHALPPGADPYGPPGPPPAPPIQGGSMGMSVAPNMSETDAMMQQIMQQYAAQQEAQRAAQAGYVPMGGPPMSPHPPFPPKPNAPGRARGGPGGFIL